MASIGIYRVIIAAVTLLAIPVILPVLVGYGLAAWVAGDSRTAAIAALSGGFGNEAAIAALAGSSLTFGLTVRLTIGHVLDGVWAGTRNVDHEAWVLGVGSFRHWRPPDPPVTTEELGLGSAVGWVGAGLGGLMLAALSALALPPPNAVAVGLVADGGASVATWFAALFPSLVRTTIAAVLGAFAGAIWSTSGPRTG